MELLDRIEQRMNLQDFDEIRENKLRWFGHLMKRHRSEALHNYRSFIKEYG